MKQLNLFPLRPITWTSDRAGYDQCPICHETRVTDEIHNKLTFLCGSSKLLNETTPCEGKFYLQAVQNGQEKSW